MSKRRFEGRVAKLRSRRKQLLRKKSQSPRGAHVEHLEAKMLLTGPQLVGITPNADELLSDGDTRNTAPQQLTFRFDENQVIDASTVSGIGMVQADTGQTIAPGFIGLGEAANEVILRFAEALEDGSYRVDIQGSGPNALRNTSGEAFNEGVSSSVSFSLDLAPLVTAVVPQPISTAGGLSQARNRIIVHFNDDDLLISAAEQPRFYQLISTADTITNEDDVVHFPVSVSYNTINDTATLTFASDLADLSGEGTYRLRIGTDEAIPAIPVATELTEDVGDTFATGHDLGVLGRADQVVSSAIDAVAYPLNYPGGFGEPGRPSFPVIEADETPGITVVEYNFQPIIEIPDPTDPTGEAVIPFFNLITEEQKERAREIVDILAAQAGVQFIETLDSGITVGTATLPGLFEDIVAVPFTFDNDEFGGNWFVEAMRQMIAQLDDEFFAPPDPLFLLEDPTRDFAFLTPIFVSPLLPDAPVIDPLQAEQLYPRNSSVVNLNRTHRPDSNDDDVYQFDLATRGVVTVETIAERVGSGLDSAIRLYRQQGATPVLMAQNDDYFGSDSFLELELEPGSYFVTVASTGLDYDPTSGNGIGGISQGTYDLRVSFQPNIANSLVDASGIALDGDSDGVAGGVFNYWFQVRDVENTIYVDKAASGAGQRGSLSSPFNRIDLAFLASRPGDIVRIVGNGGTDGNLSTLADNRAYEIGFDQFGAQLADGGAMVLPQGVTTMIDAGAIFKLRQSSIQVGSSSVAIDLSGSAIQVLGTPANSVTFTSFNDESIGIDTNPLPTNPEAGDWGGILIRNDLDRAEGRFDYEQIGVFPNYINHADMRFGGGRVSISSVERVIDPVHLIDARADVSFNRITFSADAAISVNPDAFEETRFHAVDSLGIDWQAEPFTPDYARFGPDIHNNQLTDNTTNGLFVRINTIAAQRLERMTVTGRWDDLDIVHVVPENLIIEGDVGAVFRNPDGSLTPRVGAGLKIDPGMIVKLDGARIEATVGSHLLAEGEAGRSIIFTSLLDDRFGAGGTFDTSNDARTPAPADWSGLYVAPIGKLSLDHAVIAYGGGLSRVEGSFTAFNAIEVHQADARITNSIIEFSGSGRGGQADLNRPGRPDNAKGAIFVRGSSVVIVNNIIRETKGIESPVINMDLHSLNDTLFTDPGRSTGHVDRITAYPNNQGALIRQNRLANNSINGMEVRGGTISQGTVLDDTDIVHVLFESIDVPDFLSSGGLRLESSSEESLVIKLAGNKAGFVGSGSATGSLDRIGGILQIVGQPGHPVVMTSLYDDTVGAGFDTSGRPLNVTSSFNRPLPTQPADSFQLDLNYGPILRDLPTYRQATELAARIWESLIEDPIRVTIDVEFSDLGAGTLGVTSNEMAFLDFNNVIDEIGGDTGTRQHEQIARDLPTYEDFIENVIVPDDPGNPFTINELMAVPMANAKALGINVDGLPQVASAYDATETRDATILMNDDFDMWDYDRTDGILPSLFDFTGVMIHEIGHALGFVSAVDDVDAALGNPGNNRDLNIHPFDMFRTSPGEGAEDFANAPRNLDPRQVQVVYDGGFFDPITPRNYGAIDISNLTIGDVPMSLGSEFGDGAQASHLKDDVFLNGLELGMMDPSSPGPGREIGITQVDRQMFDLIGWDIVGGPVPGDWRGVTFETLTHDANLGIVLERESTDSTEIGNAIPDLAQFLGSIAPNAKSADENNRLGFTVQGLLNSNRDVDVYSFDANAGTQIWLDIDRTDVTLDTVVELIDANGRTLVRSDNSHAEALGESELFKLPGQQATTLPLSPFGSEDYFSINEKDAGFRVFLPGASGTRNTYHLRVRSSSDRIDVLSAGQSDGIYELQLRLQELDQLPGSTVRFADINYAVDGVRVRGLPGFSPLAGTVAEDGSLNDDLPIPTFPEFNMLTIEPVRQDERFADAEETTTEDLVRDPLRLVEDPFYARTTDPTETEFQDAQSVGNVGQTRSGSITISGSLDFNFAPEVLLPPDLAGLPDVDWYEFEVDGETTLTFDVDYASGIAGPNTSIYIYEPFYRTAGVREELVAAKLIYSSKDGRDNDDVPAPLSGANLNDLGRGSVSTDDPFLGPVPIIPTGAPSLTTGGFRFLVAITAGLEPVEFNQFRIGVPLMDPERDATAGRGVLEIPPTPNNPFIRLEPVDSVVRVLQDTFEADDLEVSTVAVPHHLGDVPLIISTQASLSLVNPFNGSNGGVVGPLDTPIGDFDLRAGLGDVLRDDWNLYAYSQGADDATSGNYLVINPEDATMRGVDNAGGGGGGGGGQGGGGGGQTIFTDDGLTTRMLVPDADPMNPPQLQPSDTGVLYEAFEFFDDTIGYAIGHRPDIGVYNILYQFDVPRGTTLGSEPDDDFFTMLPPAPDGVTAVTNIAERGVICTDPADPNCVNAADPGDVDTILSILSDVVVGGDLVITDGMTVGTADSQLVEINIGPELVFDLDFAAGKFFMDGDTFFVNGSLYEVDTGRVLTVADPTAIADGDTFTIANDSARNQQQATFEFDLLGDGVSEGNIAVVLDGSVPFDGTVAAVAMLDAINSAGIGLRATNINERISLQGDSRASDIAISNPAGLVVVGSFGIDRGVAFHLEETFNERQVGEVFTTVLGDEAVALNDRVVFPGGAADFSDLVSRQIVMSSSADSELGNPSALGVEVLPSDTREDVAAKIAEVLSADVNGWQVVLSGNTFTATPDSEIMAIGGTNPGGRVMGMHFVSGQLYVVTDKGGLYTVPGFAGEAGGIPIGADYIATSTDLSGARFSGLTLGPPNIEGGRYASTLFATTSRGELYAFDKTGLPQEVFADGVASVSTGVSGANGLLFSPADENLWHVTNRKGPDPGHGQLDAFGFREFTDAGMSFHFGDSNPDLTENRNYNFPGGSHGSLITNPFALEGYTAGDQPTLYFNYFLATDASDPESPSGVDSFRVFVNDETAEEGRGEWVLLGSNQIIDVLLEGATPLFDNTWEDQAELFPEDPQEPDDAEFILRRNGLRDPYTENRSALDQDGQPVEDETRLPVPSEEATIWRQARIDLSEFAGSSSLRLRFDFSSSGSFGLGRGSGGVELRAVGGDRLADGDQFVIDDVTFEFDKGLALQVPTAALVGDGELVLLEGPFSTAMALHFVKEVPTEKAIYVSPDLVPVDRQSFQLSLDGQRTRFTYDDNNDVNGIGVDLTSGPLVDAIAAAINAAGMPYTASVQGDVLFISDPLVELLPGSSGLLDATAVVVSNDMGPVGVGTAAADSINAADVGVSAVQDGRSLLLQGVRKVDVAAGSFFAGSGIPGQNDPSVDGIHVLSVDSQMSANDVAAIIAAAVTDVFAGGQSGAVKTYENTIYIHEHRVSTAGPLGLAATLPGDAGHLYNPLRGLDNQLQYVEIDDDQQGGGGGGGGVGNLDPDNPYDETGNNFIVPYEGVYVDDIIVGFAARGEKVEDHRLTSIEIAQMIPTDDPEERARVLRPQTQRGRGTDFDEIRNDLNGRPPLLPDDNGVFPDPPQPDMVWDGTEVVPMVDRSHFLPEPPVFVIDPDFAGSLTGPYQLEIRFASGATVSRLAEGELIDPRERLSRSTTLFAPSGLELADGQFISLTDGNKTLTLEYESVAVGGGVAAGNVAVPFSVDDSPLDVAATIRDAINNSPLIRSVLGITAAGADGSVTGLPSTNAVQLHGPLIFVLPGSTIEFDLTTANESSNPVAVQGQIIVASNSISHSQMFGVVTEDGYRAVPDPLLFDSEDLLVHWPGQVGDFSSALGSAKDLVAANVDNQLPSVVVANNVIARSGAGGIHSSGDPGGYMITPPLGGEPNATEVWDNYPFIFAITDHLGKTVQFEFDTDGALNTVTPTVPVTITPTADCPLAVACMPRTGSPNDPNMSTELSRAIMGSGLDVTVYQNANFLESANPLFIEGAADVVGIAVGESLNTLVLTDWFTPWYDKVDGLRTYSRIVNNTIVGKGGRLTDNNEVVLEVFNPLPGQDATKNVLVNDFSDSGILIDDFAFPTVINNITVNLENGIKSDLSANDSVVGAMLFQNNIRNTSNINVGDFPLVLRPNDPLFVNEANDNFYLSPLTRAIDSSIDSLEDRPAFVSVKEPIGIPRSNILSPERDVLGQLREDDPNVETPSGLGQNVFKDRGAIDRVDFVGPTISLVNPRDNDQAGLDKNRAPTIVALESVRLTNFRLQFSDSAGGGGEGTGIDSDTVTSQSVVLRRDGQVLQAGVDYTFSFDATNGVIRLTPTAGIWQNGRTYSLQLSPTIQDVAGNALQANQPTGGTRFTITTAAGSDYGDAPAPYPTLLFDNGAFHNLVPDFFLGSGVTEDTDGQPNVNAAADGADDGVTLPSVLLRNANNTITVQASANGFLDAWLDFNQNGDWNDPGEAIFTSRALSAGANTLTVRVPADALAGNTFARFRFSSAGGLAPTGSAANGEVEDYRVEINPGNIWQNEGEPLDTNGDGSVSPVDVLRVIQEINNKRASDPVTGELTIPAVEPNTPASVGFVDVNGDGFVTPSDALAIIRFINQATVAGAEPAEAALAAALLEPITVDPIGEMLRNPVVELPEAVRPQPKGEAFLVDELDLVLDDIVEDLVGDAPSSLDEALADLDWD